MNKIYYKTTQRAITNEKVLVLNLWILTLALVGIS